MFSLFQYRTDTVVQINLSALAPPDCQSINSKVFFDTQCSFTCASHIKHLTDSHFTNFISRQTSRLYHYLTSDITMQESEPQIQPWSNCVIWTYPMIPKWFALYQETKSQRHDKKAFMIFRLKKINLKKETDSLYSFDQNLRLLWTLLLLKQNKEAEYYQIISKFWNKKLRMIFPPFFGLTLRLLSSRSEKNSPHSKTNKTCKENQLEWIWNL